MTLTSQRAAANARPTGGIFAALALLGAATATGAASAVARSRTPVACPERCRAPQSARTYPAASSRRCRYARGGARGAAAEPGGRDDRHLRADRQRDGALPRRLREQGDVHAHRRVRPDHPGLLSRPQGSRDRRAHRARDAVYALAGLTGVVGHRVPPLQRRQAARRLLLAEPVLRRPAGRAGGDLACRA